MKRAAAVFAVAAALLPGRARVLCPGYFPDNDLKIPVIRPAAAGGLSERQFNEALDRLEAVYAPIIARSGGTLELRRLWEDGTVNASATRQGDRLIVNMFGGMARHPQMTADAFTLIACHETGHHLGGAPKARGAGRSWASNEGQADYYANLKCMRRLFAGTGMPSGADAALRGVCAASFSPAGEQAACARLALASLAVSRVGHALGGGRGAAPAFDTPDPRVVSATQDGHPAAQCRLDTQLHAALCPKPLDGNLDDNDPAVGTCTRAEGFTVGVRPSCWFKPASNPLPGLYLADGAGIGS